MTPKIAHYALIMSMFINIGICYAAADDDDAYFESCRALVERELQSAEFAEYPRPLIERENARRRLIGSLLINRDIWNKRSDLSSIQKRCLESGFLRSDIRPVVNAAHVSDLMHQNAPWHEGSSTIWLALKRCLADVAVTDMSWFSEFSAGDDFPIWFGAVVGFPVSAVSVVTSSMCSPTAGCVTCACGVGIPLAMKYLAHAQQTKRGERIFRAIDWLSQNSAWQERVAPVAPRPITIDDIAEITVRKYQYPPKEKQD
jgi:hypothetical protein